MRFCFYSDYKDLIGGYTTLLLALIKELYRQNQEVVLMNFKQGLIADLLIKENVIIEIIDLENIKWNKIHEKIFPTDILIITKFAEPFKYLLKIDPRVVYFDINDFICQISDYKYGIGFPSLGKRLVKQLLKKKSLFFMDDTGIFNLRHYFAMEVDEPIFVPIPVEVPKENYYLKRDRNPGHTLRLTYIGRSVDWKMMPLIKIIEDCATVSVSKKINMSIVVDSITEFKKYINTNDFIDAGNFAIDVTENIMPSAISDFLLQNSDLHFAMGTAALDAAKLGVPTVLVDYSVKKFPADYCYKWLYETTGYSLGKNLDKLSVSNSLSMKNLLTMLSDDQEKVSDLSKRSFNYVVNNHSVDKIVSNLVVICRQADFRLSNARYLIPYYYKAHHIIKSTVEFLSIKKSRSGMQ